MPSLEDQLRELGAGDWHETIADMSTREIADTYGISRGAAWRAKTGRTRAPAFTKTNEFRDQAAADAFRRARRINPLRVTVWEKSPRRRTVREIGAIDADELLDPEEVAENLEAGDYNAAALALEAQLLNAYGDAGGMDSLADYLDILDVDELTFD
jgi:hypothetical protein